jgi:hypothetical protein
MANRLVLDSCVNCRNLWKTIECGSCDCTRDYSKGLSPAEVSWLRRHGKTVEIQKPLKQYRMGEVELPLKRVLLMAQKLADESSALASVTKGISENAQKRRRNSRRKNAKITMQITVDDLEKSRVNLEQKRKASLKKSEDVVVLGVLDGNLGAGQIQGWIEKRLRLDNAKLQC